jgi:hypothetical protein
MEQVSTVKPSGGAVVFSDRSRLAAGLLGIFLGSIGVHSFYLGRTKRGVVQIIVSLITLGAGGLWGFIEGIVIIADGNWKDSQDRPLKKYSEGSVIVSVNKS